MVFLISASYLKKCCFFYLKQNRFYSRCCSLVKNCTISSPTPPPPIIVDGKHVTITPMSGARIIKGTVSPRLYSPENGIHGQFLLRICSNEFKPKNGKIIFDFLKMCQQFLSQTSHKHIISGQVYSDDMVTLKRLCHQTRIT